MKRNKSRYRILRVLDIILILVLAHGVIYAQNDLNGRTTEWNITQQKNSDTGETRDIASILIMTSDEVQWGQSADMMFGMNITEITGEWDQTTNTGEVVCEVDIPDEDGRGTVKFKGDGTNITIEIKITFNNGSSNLLLICSQISYDAN